VNGVVVGLLFSSDKMRGKFLKKEGGGETPTPSAPFALAPQVP